MWNRHRGIAIQVALASLVVITFGRPVYCQRESKDYRAVIVVPERIQVAQSTVIPISVAVQRLHLSLQAASVRIAASDGYLDGEKLKRIDDRIVETEQAADSVYDVQLILRHPPAAAEKSIKIWVSGPGDNGDEMGSATIRIVRPRRIDFLSIPYRIATDGKSTSTVRLRVTDDEGGAVAGMRFVLRGSHPAAKSPDVVVGAVTNAKGEAIFMVPASKEHGVSNMQILTLGMATPVFASKTFNVVYTDNSYRGEEIARDEWWKKPIIISD